MVHDTLRQLVDKYDSFLIDVYGVLYDGNELYGGVKELLKEIMDDGKRVVILSNTTAISDVCKKKYKEKGLIEGVHYNEFLSSGEVFRAFINDFSKNFHTYISIFSKGHEIFNESGLREVDSIKDADFVYVGIMDLHWSMLTVDDMKTKSGEPISIDDILSARCSDIEGLDEITCVLEECLSFDKSLLVLNPDVFAIESVGWARRPVMRQGAIGWFYEAIGGKVIYFGKPYGIVYDYAKQHLRGCSRTAMIGDTPWTDILGGNMAGFDTIMTLTGMFSRFARNMPDSLSPDEKVELMLTEIAGKMIRKNLVSFSQRPTCVINKLA
jgi:HAD superfamily hydrolase (TIGR01450 family)